MHDLECQKCGEYVGPGTAGTHLILTVLLVLDDIEQVRVDLLQGRIEDLGPLQGDNVRAFEPVLLPSGIGRLSEAPATHCHV